MDTQEQADYKIAFYTSSDGSRTVILTMFIEPDSVKRDPKLHTTNFVIEIQENKQSRRPEANWKKL